MGLHRTMQSDADCVRGLFNGRLRHEFLNENKLLASLDGQTPTEFAKRLRSTPPVLLELRKGSLRPVLTETAPAEKTAKEQTPEPPGSRGNGTQHVAVFCL
ncbi:MAG: hypothetical protein AAF667_10290 [Pseudomonadota bacterium]